MPSRLRTRRMLPVLFLALALAACGDPADGDGAPDGGVDPSDGGATLPDGGAPADAGDSDAGDAPDGGEVPDAGDPADAGEQTDAGADPDGGTGETVTVRILAGNLSSGNYQSWQDPGIRILQGLAPDVALLQEMNYGDNDAAAMDDFVDRAFGPGFDWWREGGAQIPNAIVSRYPIVEAGEWTDVEVSNRDFVWARIDVPGPVDLWAVSLHLLTDDGDRPYECRALVELIRAHIPDADDLVVGGDFNTDTRTESCVDTLAAELEPTATVPVDQDGVGGTNASRSKPYDWVMADADLQARQVPTRIGALAFPEGLVFDSRVFQPLSAVAPVLASDSGAPQMQHMAVVKDYAWPAE